MLGAEKPPAAYLPPLVEEAPYALTDPGRLTEGHTAAIRELLDLASCVAQARKIPLGSIRLTVFARTDERGARDHILDALRKRGVPADRLERVGRAVVDVVAAWHRARVVVDRLREEIGRALRKDRRLGGGDPAGIVQPGDLTADDAALETSPWGAPPDPHARSFVVIITSRENTPAEAVDQAPAADAPPASAAPAPMINVFCGGCCREKEKDAGGAAGSGTKTPTRSIRVGPPEFELLLGAAIPVEHRTREYLYRELGMLAVGFRLPIERFETGLRLLFLIGAHPITFNDVKADQLIVAGGAMAQAGVRVVDAAPARLALGAQGGWLYVFRRMTRQDHPFEGVEERQQGHVPLAGGWLRLDVRLSDRTSLSFEGTAGVAPIKTEVDTPLNVTATVMGGINHAF